MLCNSTSEQMLCMLFAAQNCLFQHFNIFSWQNNEIKVQPWWLGGRASASHSVEVGVQTLIKCYLGGSNPIEVWCINRSVEETLCRNSHCRTPGPSKIGFIIHAFNVSCYTVEIAKAFPLRINSSELIRRNC